MKLPLPAHGERTGSDCTVLMEQSKVKQSAGYVIPPDRLICVSCNSIGNWVGFMAFSFLFEGEVISCTVLLEVSEYLMSPTFSPALFLAPLPSGEEGAPPLPISSLTLSPILHAFTALRFVFRCFHVQQYARLPFFFPEDANESRVAPWFQCDVQKLTCVSI